MNRAWCSSIHYGAPTRTAGRGIAIAFLELKTWAWFRQGRQNEDRAKPGRLGKLTALAPVFVECLGNIPALDTSRNFR